MTETKIEKSRGRKGLLASVGITSAVWAAVLAAVLVPGSPQPDAASAASDGGAAVAVAAASTVATAVQEAEEEAEERIAARYVPVSTELYVGKGIESQVTVTITPAESEVVYLSADTNAAKSYKMTMQVWVLDEAASSIEYREFSCGGSLLAVERGTITASPQYSTDDMTYWEVEWDDEEGAIDQYLFPAVKDFGDHIAHDGSGGWAWADHEAENERLAQMCTDWGIQPATFVVGS